MPLYEYQCNDCDATLETIQAFSAPPLEECPECGRPSLKKLLSAPAFQFKGSGWYVNDYARKDNANGGKSNGASANDSAESNGKTAKSSSDSSKKTESSASSPSKSETSSPAATP